MTKEMVTTTPYCATIYTGIFFTFLLFRKSKYKMLCVDGLLLVSKPLYLIEII